MADMQDEPNEEENVNPNGISQEEQAALNKLMVSPQPNEDLSQHYKKPVVVHPYRIPRLDDICASYIARNLNEYPILDSVPNEYIENIVNEIDLSSLEINRVSTTISCDKLWQRMCTERWPNCHAHRKHVCSWPSPSESNGLAPSPWKRVYLEKHINELLESYHASPSELSNVNLSRLLQSIKCAAPFIRCIKLNQLPSHLDLSQILPLFPNLSCLDITYKTLNIGMNYKEEDFGMNLNDALNISKYLHHSTKSLTSLILSESLIDDETIHILMAGLQQNKSILSLDLSLNKISDVGARRLSQYMAATNILRRLNLSSNQINDDGVQYIASKLHSSRLEALDLSLNNIDDKGAEHLFEAISKNTTLQNVNISCNRITDESFGAFIKCLQVNKSLRCLNVSGNQLIPSSSGSAAQSSTSSRPQSRAGAVSVDSKAQEAVEDKMQTARKQYFKQMQQVLLNENMNLIELELQHIGLTKLEMQTLQKILKPRQVKRDQAERKKRIAAAKLQ